MTKDNSKNIRYTKEEKLIARTLPAESISTSNLSVETGINKLTQATWKTEATVSQVKGTNTYSKTISVSEIGGVLKK